MLLGKIFIDKPIILAPMEEITDISFRLLCKQMGADIVCTEFASSDALIRNVPKAQKKIVVLDDERPVGIQIFGRDEEAMELATRIAEAAHPDFIDINAGCSTRKHALRGLGAGLLKDLGLFERIVKKTVQSTSLPVTVKTRLGWDEKSIAILEVARMVEQAGACAITIHCRTRSQIFKGKVDWTWLEKVKKVVRIPVIANGDIISCDDVKFLFDIGCDGVMIGRAAVANPWIFQQARLFLQTGQRLPDPAFRDRMELCLRHLRLFMQYRGLENGVYPFRKFFSAYLKGTPYAARLRTELMKIVDFNVLIEKLDMICHEYPSPLIFESITK